MKYALAVTSFALALLCVHAADAAWDQDGDPIAVYQQNQTGVVAVPDGSGGAFLAWQDARTLEQDIYAQRVAADGTAMWGAGGIPVCTASDQQWSPAMVSDGAGGVVILWEDERNGGSSNTDVYAQRVNANGVTQWIDNGVAVCTATGRQIYIDARFDGGTVLAAWQDSRSGSPDIYVQRLGLNGSALWAANGVGAVQLIASNQNNPVVVSDFAGGAIVAWVDDRNAMTQVYAQEINLFGSVGWTVNGVNIDPGLTADDPSILEDGAGGVFIAYNDTDGDSDIYLQRRASSGSQMWKKPVLELAGLQQYCVITSDGAGGVILAWQDQRDDSDIYAQRVTGLGARMWSGDGVAVCNDPGNQYFPAIASDGAGGAIVAWKDIRDDNGDVYAQRLRPNGAVQWATDGVPVSTAYNAQTDVVLTVDGDGATLAAWNDNRSVAGNDIYAQRIEPNYGAWGMPEPLITSAVDDPADQGGDVAVNWKASGYDTFLYPNIYQYTMWRAVDPVAASAMKMVTLASFAPEDGVDAAVPVVRKETTASGDYYWELMGTQTAVRAAGYSMLVATRKDSTGGDPATHYFQVIAHQTAVNGHYYVSNVVSGHSVDNLAPASPLSLVAQRVGNYVRLDWIPSGENEPDFRDYAVYRANTSSISPTPVFFLSYTVDAMLWDQDVTPDMPYYYIVTAVDTHENQSAPSNEAAVFATTTGVGDTPALTTLQLGANVPNPFGTSTELQVGLPAGADVTVDVYDVAGRRVAAISAPAMGAGWHALRFNGRNTRGAPLPSGVYFYAVHAAGRTATQKFVIER